MKTVLTHKTIITTPFLTQHNKKNSMWCRFLYTVYSCFNTKVPGVTGRTASFLRPTASRTDFLFFSIPT